MDQPTLTVQQLAITNMPFNQKEQEIIRFGLENGKSRQEVEFALNKYRTGATSPEADTQPQQPSAPAGGIIGNNIREGISGLKTTYGGGPNSIGAKIIDNVKTGAKDIQEGVSGVTDVFGRGDAANVAAKTKIAKGVIKAGARTAGDVAGAIYAPVAAAVGATGIGKVFDKAANAIVDSPLGQAITNNKAVQDFAMNHPNAGDDFSRAMSLAFAARDKGKIDPKTVVPRTVEQVKSAGSKITSPVRALENKVANSEFMNKSVDEMRSNKVRSGYMEQNNRVKSVNNAFKEGTRTYKGLDGKTEKVTPVDTLSKNNIKPEINNGTIDMGDYKNGIGGLGRIKNIVDDIDNQIVTKIGDGSTNIEAFKKATIAEIKKNSSLKQTGKVEPTLRKIETVFDDYKNSYGENISNKEINAIRKAMNNEWNPETVDAARAVGNAAREIVYNTTSDKAVKALLQEQGKLLAARTYAEAINGTKVTGGRLGNYAMRTGGAVIGSTIKDVPIIGPIAGMLGGEYLARAMQQSQFTSFGAELKALAQRSNKSQPIKSASATPKSSISPKSSSNFPTGKAPAIPMEGSIEQLIEKNGGFKAGTRAIFDTALQTKDKAGLLKILPEIPEAYKTQFSKEIVKIIGS